MRFLFCFGLGIEGVLVLIDSGECPMFLSGTHPPLIGTSKKKKNQWRRFRVPLHYL